MRQIDSYSNHECLRKEKTFLDKKKRRFNFFQTHAKRFDMRFKCVLKTLRSFTSLNAEKLQPVALKLV